MSVTNNIVNCFKTFPSDIKELISSIKDPGLKKTWNEKKDLINKIALKAFAGLFMLGGVALLIAFSFTAVALSAAGYGVATIVVCGVIRSFSISFFIGSGAYAANAAGQLGLKSHSMVNFCES